MSFLLFLFLLFPFLLFPFPVSVSCTLIPLTVNPEKLPAVSFVGISSYTPFPTQKCW